MLGPAGPAKDMAIGLLGFLDREPRQVWWCHWEGLKTISVVSLCGTGQTAVVSQPTGLYRRVFAFSVQAGERPIALDRGIIAQRTLFSPIPILWNSRLICELSWNPPGYTSSQPPYWADFYYPSPGPKQRGLALKPIGTCRELDLNGRTRLQAFAPSRSRYAVQRRLVAKGDAIPLTFSGKRPKAAALVNSGEVRLETLLGESIWVVNGTGYAPSALLCVKHGVLLNPCRLPLILGGLVVVLATPDLEVDLSQFSPIRDSESWEHLVQGLRSRSQQVIREVELNAQQLYRGDRSMLPTVGLGGAVGAAFGTAVAFGGSLPVALLGATLGSLATMAGIFRYYQVTHRDRLRVVRKATRPE